MHICRIEWWNTKDMPSVLYQTGFRQKLWLRCWFARPQTVRQEEVIIDGHGKEFVTSSRQVKRYRVETLPIHDAQLFALSLIRDHSNKQLINTETGEVFQMDNFTFASEPIGNAHSKGIIEFDVNENINTGHGTNYVLGECAVVE